MAVKVGILIDKLLKKAGVDTEAKKEELKALLELEAEMSDEYADKLNKGLLTVEAAKSNPEVNKALRQSILGIADTKMLDMLTELGVTPSDEFSSEKNTYEKINLFSKALFEAGKKKAEVSNKESVHETLKKEKDAYLLKEAEYQKKLKDLTDAITAKETEFKLTRENDLTTFELQKILLGKDYVFPKEMDSSLKVATALGAVNSALAKQGLMIKRNEAGQLAISDKEGNPAYNSNHEKIDDPSAYIDGVLAQNKLLKINESGSQQQQAHGSNGAPFIPGSNGNNGKNSYVLDEIEAQLAEMGVK